MIIHVVSSGKLGIRLITTATRCLSLVHTLSYRMAELKTPFMNERNQKINSKWNIVDNKSVVYNINIDKQYMRAEQVESEGRLAAASL